MNKLYLKINYLKQTKHILSSDKPNKNKLNELKRITNKMKLTNTDRKRMSELIFISSNVM